MNISEGWIGSLQLADHRFVYVMQRASSLTEDAHTTRAQLLAHASSFLWSEGTTPLHMTISKLERQVAERRTRLSFVREDVEAARSEVEIQKEQLATCMNLLHTLEEDVARHEATECELARRRALCLGTMAAGRQEARQILSFLQRHREAYRREWREVQRFQRAVEEETRRLEGAQRMCDGTTVELMRVRHQRIEAEEELACLTRSSPVRFPHQEPSDVESILSERQDSLSSREHPSTPCIEESVPPSSSFWRACGLDDDMACKRVQSLIRGWLTRRKFRRMIQEYSKSKESIQQRRRLKVIHEIYVSELKYVSDLRCLIKVFLEPMQSLVGTSKQIASDEEIRLIFSNVVDIHHLQEEVFAGIEKEMKSVNPDWHVGAVLLKAAPTMTVYTTFINNFPKSQVVRRVCSSRRSFEQFVKEDVRASLDLDALLITPIQRVTRYNLLFKELLNNTPEHHVDFREVQDAVMYTKKLARFLNEAKRDFDRQDTVVELEKQMQGDHETLVTPNRHLIRKGPAVLKSSKDSDLSSPRDRFLILFNDAMVVAKSTSRGLYFKRQIPLFGAHVHDDTVVDKSSFLVILSDQEILEVTPRTGEDKVSWIMDLDRVVEQLGSHLSLLSLKDMLGRSGLDESYFGVLKRRRMSIADGPWSWVQRMVKHAGDPVVGIPTCRKRVGDVFKGSDAVEWILTNFKFDSRFQACIVGDSLVQAHLIVGVTHEETFLDGDYWYRFVDECDVMDEYNPGGDDYVCTWQQLEAAPLHGHLYLTEDQVLFVSKVFGRKAKETIPLHRVERCKPSGERSLIFYSNDGPTYEFRFLSSILRDNALDTIREYMASPKGLEGGTDRMGEGAGSPAFAMSAKDWQLLFEGATCSTYKKDTTILHEGHYKECLFQIGRGSVRVEKVSSNGEREVIAQLGATDIFGELSFIEEKAFSAFIVADDPEVDVYRVDGPYTRSLFVQHAGFAGRFYSFLCINLARRLRKLNMSKLFVYRTHSTNNLSGGRSIQRARTEGKVADIHLSYSEKYQRLFGLIEDTLVEEHVCDHKGFFHENVGMFNYRGTLYIGRKNLCFYATWFGMKLKLIFPMDTITKQVFTIEKRTMEMFTSRNEHHLFTFTTTDDVEHVRSCLEGMRRSLSVDEDASSPNYNLGRVRSMPNLDPRHGGLIAFMRKSQQRLSARLEGEIAEKEDRAWHRIVSGQDTAPLTFNAGDTVFVEGSEMHCMYQVAWGSVCVVGTTRGGLTLTLATLGPGELVGEVSFLEGVRAHATVVAGVTGVGLYTVDNAHLKSLFAAEPELAEVFFQHLAQVLAARLRRTSNLLL